jgi:hypothetical protein
MTRHENVMGGMYIQHGEIFLKYFSRETGNTDHFVDAVTEKRY